MSRLNAELEEMMKERKAIENPEHVEIPDEEFEEATTFEEYKKANPDKVSDEVVVSITL